jgi:hypothetical protein
MLKKIFIFTTLILLMIALSSCGDPDATDLDFANSGPTPMETAEALWTDLMKMAIIEDDLLSSSGEMMNAITAATSTEIIDADVDSCKVTITWPNVASILEKEIAALPDELPKDQVDDMYLQVAKAVSENRCEMLEETFEIAILTDEIGNKTLDLPTEAVIALTGGIAGIQ